MSLMIGLFAPACGGAAPAPATAAEAPAAPLRDGPLTDFVAAAGLRWMIVAELESLASNPEFATALAPLFPATRLDAFAASSAVDLRHVPHALAAGFDYATLWMADVRRGSVEVEQRFGERIVSGAVHKAPHPRIRLVTGVIGRTPETMASIDARLVAVAVGDPIPAKVVAGYALGKLRSPTALRGAALSTLPRDLEQAPLRAYAAGPFGQEWLSGAHGLLGAALAVGASAEPLARGTVQLNVVLSGDWKAEGPDAPARLLSTWEDLAQSSLGHLLGLDALAAAPVISVTPDHLKLSVELRTSTLGKGLYDAVAADVEELFRAPSAAPGTLQQQR